MANQTIGKIVCADFATVDDVLEAAQAGKLPDVGPVTLLPSGRIGPLVEILIANRDVPQILETVNFRIPFVGTIHSAMTAGQVSGSGYRSRAGVFPLSRRVDAPQEDWNLWCHRAEQAAGLVELPKPLAAAIVGAMIEFQENIDVHSGRPGTGVIAFAAARGHFEIVVADAGMGVLASLRQSPAFAGLEDAGDALKVAISDGNSRFGAQSGHGFGMGQMFRALANHDGELRFRSDDYALIVRGHSPSLSGTVELRQKARLRGLVISVLCPTPSGLFLD